MTDKRIHPLEDISIRVEGVKAESRTNSTDLFFKTHAVGHTGDVNVCAIFSPSENSFDVESGPILITAGIHKDDKKKCGEILFFDLKSAGYLGRIYAHDDFVSAIAVYNPNLSTTIPPYRDPVLLTGSNDGSIISKPLLYIYILKYYKISLEVS